MAEAADENKKNQAGRVGYLLLLDKEMQNRKQNADVSFSK